MAVGRSTASLEPPVPAPNRPGRPPRPSRSGRRGRLLFATVAAAWLAFVLAGLVLAGRWWLWLLPSALPPLLLAVVPVLLVACALLSRPLNRPVLVVAAVSLLLGAPRSGLRPDALWTSTVVPPGAVHVFAWNTEYWNQDDDADRFYRYLRAQRADVYLLQEYLRWDHDRPLDGELPEADLARLRREFPGYAVAERGELLTLSRFPIVAQPPVAPDPAASGDPTTDFRRVFRDAKVLRTDLRIGQATVSFYNVHIAVPIKPVSPFSGDFYRFTKQAEPQRRQQLRGLAGDVTGNPYPVVVAGDFNTSPAMADLNALPGRLRDAATAGTSPYPASWGIGGLPLWQLDWSFITPEVAVHRYGFRSAQGLSDHRAQELWITLDSSPQR